MRWVRRHGLFDRRDGNSNQPPTRASEINQRPLPMTEFRDEARLAHSVLTLLQDVRSRRVGVLRTRIGRERGWPPMRRSQFEAGRSPRGALVVGSPEEVVEKILFEHDLFGNQRFMAQISVGALPHEKAMRAIELFGTAVAPAVRKELARRTAAGAGGPAAV